MVWGRWAWGWLRALESLGFYIFRARKDFLFQATIALLVGMLAQSRKPVLPRSTVSEGRQPGPGALSSRSEVFPLPICLVEAVGSY